MSNRFRGKPCVLCPNPSEGVGEHVHSRWFITDFNGEGPFFVERNGQRIRRRDGNEVQDQSLPGVHVPMCKSHNNLLNSLVEEPAKAVVRSIISRDASHVWPVLSPDEAAALGRWLLKVAQLRSHPDAEHDNPHVQKLSKVRDRTLLLPECLAWMRDGVEPSDDFSVFVTRRQVAGAEPPWAEDTQRVELPRRVIVDGVVRSFGTWATGIRGVEATAVWHPGWPIEHALVASGRAVRVWPRPVGPVDLSKLPEVHPREFSFFMGGTELSFSAEEFLHAAQSPLSVEHSPFMAGPSDVFSTPEHGPVAD